MSRQISCGFKILDKLGVRIKKIKNTLLVGFFENQSKSNIFSKENPCKIYSTLCKTNHSKFYIPSFSSLFLSFYLPFIKTQHLQDQHGGSLMILQTFILHPQHKPFVFFALIFTCMSFYRVRKTKVERVYQSLPFTKFYNKLGT